MSRDSGVRGRRQSESESESSLPGEWEAVQKRLDYLETAMLKMQKRSQKLERRLVDNEEELAAFRREVKKRMEQVSERGIGRGWEAEVESLKGEMEELHSFVKRVEKKSGEMMKEIRIGVSGGEDLEEKLERSQLKNKQYIDRAVGELKNVIKEYVRDQAELEQKIALNVGQMGRSNSRSKLSVQRSSNRSMKASQQHETSLQQKQKCRSPQSGGQNGSSRVSYLKEKLKEFEEINKKYEDKAEKKKDEGKTVQKMKEFKNYLEQSESEIEQSNLDIPNVLAASGSKWRSSQKLRYQ